MQGEGPHVRIVDLFLSHAEDVKGAYLYCHVQHRHSPFIFKPEEGNKVI